MRRFRYPVIVLAFSILALVCPAQDNTKADSLTRLLSRTRDPKVKIKLLLYLSGMYDFGDATRSLRYANQALRIAQIAEDYPGLCNSYRRLAKIYYVQSDLQKGLDCALRSREIAETHDLKTEEALAMDAIGMIYYEIGDENRSTESFFTSLKIYESLKDKTGIGQSLCRIGSLYYNQKDITKAVDYYSRSMQIARELNDREGIASNLNNLASVYTSEKSYNRALAYYQEALKINQEMGNAQLEGSNYLNIGNLYLKMENYSEALQNVGKARDIFIRLGNHVRVAKALTSLGEIFLESGQFDKSLENSKAAFAINSRYGIKEQLSQSAGLLRKVYLARKDSSAAYRYSVLEEQWKDSTRSGERQKTLARLEMQYQFDKKEQKLKLEKQRRNYSIIIMAIIIVFIIILLFQLRSQYRLKEKKSLLEKKNLEMDLEYKKKELTINVLALMKKNEMLSEITKKILTLRQEASQEETRIALKKIAGELQKSTDDEILKEFSLRFKEVHKEFYDTLLKRYPDLTPNELRLCAFLRLNMTSKEIAELTGQQISTLENARYRLRQKLGLTSSDTNLVTFLSQI
jgi:tetratricopeptide (TPR) repeat protein